MATTIDINKQNVKELLESGAKKPFVIPDYQRPYAWGYDQVETLFDDLWEFAVLNDEEDAESTYFLGSLVSYENENGEREVIDGQQRITSLFLLLRAIYTKLASVDAPTKQTENFIAEIEPALWRKDKFTGDVDYSGMHLESRVVNNEGNEILRGILETGKADPEATDNYSRNYLRFAELYEKACASNPLRIYQFIYSVLNQAIFLPITAGSQDTALTIFSTLNDRGLPLSDADIFKAKMYNARENASDKAAFIDAWKDLEEQAAYVGESIQQLFYYYMFYLRALEGDTKSTTPGIRKYYSARKFSRLDDDDLLGNLKLILNIWIVATKHERIPGEPWSTNPCIAQTLDILSSYPNEFWKYPVIIYYLTHRTKDDFEGNFLRFLRKLLSVLLTRYLVTPTINAVKSDILKLDASIAASAHPIFEFKPVDDFQIEASIKAPRNKSVRMLLKVIAYEFQSELLPDSWEIEHIFPRKWQSNFFPNESDDAVREKIEHLGNKTPFEKKLNIVAGNGYFQKKKAAYSASSIAMTRGLCSHDGEWGLEDISTRSVRVADIVMGAIAQWGRDYERGPASNVLEAPTPEDIEIINEFKARGWIS